MILDKLIESLVNKTTLNDSLPVNEYVISYFTNTFTLEKIHEIRNALKNTENIYLCDYRETVFLALQYSIKNTNYSFRDITTEEVIKKINCCYMKEASNQPDNQYKFFCEKYLLMDRSFIEIFHTDFPNIMNDLREVIEIISQAKEKLEKESQLSSYEKNRYKYIIERYGKYQDEINDFIAFKLNGFIVSKSNTIKIGVSLTLSGNKYPYSYSNYWAKYLHNPNRPHSVLAKFSYEPIDVGREAEKIFLEDKIGYQHFISKYIDEKDIINKIPDIIKSNYKLDERKNIILEALSSHSKKQYYVFISTIIPQIEGLFKDFCEIIDIDIKPNDTLPFVVGKIVNETTLLGYQYFLYELPVLRNKVTHGKILDDKEIKNISNELILDLYAIVSKFTDEYLPQNEAIVLIRQADFGDPISIMEIIEAVSENKFLLNILNGKDEKFTEFYSLKEQIDNIQKFINNDKFSDLVIERISNIKCCRDLDKWKKISTNCKKQNFFDKEYLDKWQKAIGIKNTQLSEQ